MSELNFDLGETIDMLRDTVRDFAADEIAPRAAEIDRDQPFPARAVAASWASSACSASRSRRSTAAPAWAISRMCVAMEEISPRLGLGRPVLRRALEPVRQPDPPQRHRGAEAQVPAEADLAASMSARWR